jgi:hypothetical protein
MQGVPGIGEAKLRDYGQAILEVLEKLDVGPSAVVE